MNDLEWLFHVKLGCTTTSDSEGSTFKDNCVNSNKHRPEPILSAANM